MSLEGIKAEGGRWCFGEENSSFKDREKAISSLSKEMGILPLTASVLVRRGYLTKELAEKEFAQTVRDLPDPFSLKDMDATVGRLIKAIQDRESIAIWGDYDVDGTTSTALLYFFFSDLGVRVRTYQPHRFHEGYGVNPQGIEKLFQEGVTCIVSVDSGITSFEAAEKAKELGVSLLVTDHHEPKDGLPEAETIVNPNRKDDKSGLGMLAGVGVAFYLALALRKTLRGRGYFAKKKEPNLKNLMDLVAFGTIADLAPLTGVNKVLVREGLKVLRENPSPGIEALKEIAGLPVGAYSRPITTTDIGFTLGPRVNAAGRLGSPDTALRLLIETDPQKAKEWAEELQRLNTERKGVQEEVFEKAKAQVEAMGEDLRGRRSLVLFADDWHQGVLGIVAAKISQKFHRPTVVIQFEEEGEEAIGKASVRGYGRINVYERLADCAHHLEQFGGHAAAAGLSVKRKKLQAFIESFEKSFHMNTKEEDFLPQIDVDAKAKSDEITPRLLDELEALGPFGMKNPEPVLLIEGQTRKSVLLKGKHLKLQFDHLDAIGFGLGQREWLPEEGKGLRIVGTPEWNYWKGQRKIQIRLQDFDQ